MTRWITGIILGLSLVLLLMFAPVIYIKCILIALSFLAVFEFLTISIETNILLKIVGGLLSVMGVYLLSIHNVDLRNFLGFFFFVLVISFIISFFSEKSDRERINQSAFFLFGVVYCVVLYGLLSLLLDRPYYQFWVFLAIACTAMGDTGAYITGKLCGKRKLAPRISPNKTQEGALGAIVAGMISAVIVRQIFLPTFSLGLVIVLGALIATIGIIGDLGESLLKRGFNVKDSGKIIPGHGGVLDRLDAILFTAPFIYFVSFLVKI